MVINIVSPYDNTEDNTISLPYDHKRAAEIIRALLISKGWNGPVLAKNIGRDDSYIRQILLGMRDPPEYVKRKIAIELGVTMETIWPLKTSLKSEDGSP